MSRLLDLRLLAKIMEERSGPSRDIHVGDSGARRDVETKFHRLAYETCDCANVTAYRDIKYISLKNNVCNNVSGSCCER